jgi:hypothetical protein
MELGSNVGYDVQLKVTEVLVERDNVCVCDEERGLMNEVVDELVLVGIKVGKGKLVCVAEDVYDDVLEKESVGIIVRDVVIVSVMVIEMDGVQVQVEVGVNDIVCVVVSECTDVDEPESVDEEVMLSVITEVEDVSV